MERPVKAPAKFGDFLDCEPEYFEEDFLVFEDFLKVIDKRRKPEDPRTDAEYLLNEFHIFEKFKKDEMRREWREDQRQRAFRAGRQRKQLKRSSSPVCCTFLMFIHVKKFICNISLFRSCVLQIGGSCECLGKEFWTKV